MRNVPVCSLCVRIFSKRTLFHSPTDTCMSVSMVRYTRCGIFCCRPQPPYTGRGIYNSPTHGPHTRLTMVKTIDTERGKCEFLSCICLVRSRGSYMLENYCTGARIKKATSPSFHSQCVCVLLYSPRDCERFPTKQHPTIFLIHGW